MIIIAEQRLAINIHVPKRRERRKNFFQDLKYKIKMTNMFTYKYICKKNYTIKLNIPNFILRK